MKKTNTETNKLPEYDYLKVSSAQDCTGLIPSLPTEKEEIENYEELYPFLPPIISTEGPENKY